MRRMRITVMLVVALAILGVLVALQARSTSVTHGLSRDDPAPMGTAVNAGNGLSVVLIKVERGNPVTAKLKQRNMFNPTPRLPNEHVLVTVDIANLGGGENAQVVNDISFGIVGSSNVLFAPVFAMLERPLSAQLFSGGQVAGEVLFEVPGNEWNRVLVYDATPFGGRRIFLALPR